MRISPKGFMMKSFGDFLVDIARLIIFYLNLKDFTTRL